VQLTGDVATNRGVELVSPGPTGAPAETTPPAAPQPRATLDPDISGQTLEQETCSVGNIR
jgi:hypothetical protein